MKRQQYGRTPTGPGEYREGGAEAARPKEAATLIVVRAGPKPTLLMGKRAASHRFMPNKFVFPWPIGSDRPATAGTGRPEPTGHGAAAKGHQKNRERSQTSGSRLGGHQRNL